MENNKPKLRNIAAKPVTIDGSPMILLEDPENISEQKLLIPHNEGMVTLLGCLDGQHTVADIQSEFMQRYQTFIMSDEIEDIIRKLNESHFLENERFYSFRNGILSTFRKDPVRHSSLAGSVYPREEDSLNKLLDAMMFAGRMNKSELLVLPEDRPPAGIIAPHIDFMRGGRVYGTTYGSLPPQHPPDLFIILGTLHTPADSLFVFTRKNYETPLGVVETDTEFLDNMENYVPAEILYSDEIAHRREHSIEFQVLCLQYMYRDYGPIRIVPILCSSFNEFILADEKPSSSEDFLYIINAMKAVLDSGGKVTTLVAGADLAHIGPAFGDPGEITDQFLEESNLRDDIILDAAARCDAEGFFNDIAENVDRFRICGLPPIYTMLHLLSSNEGIQVDYEQSLDPKRTTSVSFAGMLYY